MIFQKKYEFVEEKELGIELFCHSAARGVSSPRLRFTSEFGMGSTWDQRAKDTKQGVKTLKIAVKLKMKSERKRSSPRSVSKSRLHPLLDFHLTPINGWSARDLTGLTP